MQRSRTRRALVGSFVALALVATACGGGDDDDDVATDEPADDDGGEPADDDGADGDDGGDETADDDGDEGGDEPADDAPPDGSDLADEAPDEEPPAEVTRGGTLTMLLEAETDTWDIPGATCVTSCINVMNAVADTMLIVNADQELEPFLVESFEVNDDFSEWTFTAREGVTFHDGTPLDGAALQRNLTEYSRGLLQAQVFADLAGPPDESIVLLDDMTVQVTFDKPFATFGNNLAARTGWVLAPAFWDDPDRGGALPIATGPFVMEEWVRGEVTRVRANPDYWRTDASGEPLPYLDGIDFRPVPDVSTRRATMEAGDADVNMDSFAENKEFWQTTWLDEGNGVARVGPDREIGYLLLNNSKPPFDDPQIRRALAHCTDREQYIAFRSPGDLIIDGPFAEGAPGFVADPGFPQFDAEEGNRILDEVGRPEVITYGTTNVPSNLLTAQFFQDQWSSNCGLNVEIDQFEQTELVGRAISGNFEVFLWRNHGQGNPGLEFVWWHSRHAAGLALNFGRIMDPEIDELLFETWATDDLAELDRLAQEINREFASEVYNIWLNTVDWQNPYRAGVNGVQTMTLESGKPVQGALVGRVYLQEAWIDG